MPHPAPGRWSVAGLALALLATAAVYWPGLDGPLVLDDPPTLEPLRRMAAGLHDWTEVLGAAATGAAAKRPVAMLTFLANWWLDASSVRLLKLTNLLVHLVCGVLVFALARRLLRAPRVAAGARADRAALWVAAAWLLAPLLLTTVLYVVQRMAQLSALFSLAGLLCYAAARERHARGARAGGWLAGAFAACWPLAVLSKQNGALLPLLALVVELFFYAPPGRAAWRTRPVRLLAGLCALPALAVAAVLAWQPGWILDGYADRGFGMAERLLTQPRALLDHVLALLLLPFGPAAGVHHDDYVASTGLFSPPATAAALAIWAALLAAAARWRASRFGPVLFGPVFFLAAHLVESSFIPLELYFEHRSYLPSVGLFVALGCGGLLLAGQAAAPRMVAAAAVLALATSATVTASRAWTWGDAGRLFEAAVRGHPRSARAHTDLATLYMQRGAVDDALAQLRRAAAIEGGPSAGTAVHAVAAYCVAGRAPPASLLDTLAAAPSPGLDSPYAESALNWLATEFERGGCAAVPLPRLVEALTAAGAAAYEGGRHPGKYQAIAHLHTARLLALAGRPRAALAELDRASAILPGWVEPPLLAVEMHLRLGERAAARRVLDAVRGRAAARLGLYAELIGRYEAALARP